MSIWDDLPQRPPQETATSKPSLTGWSHDQVQRLEIEYRRLLRAFAYHPHVRAIPLQGDPPDQYQVEYRLRTLVMNDKNQLEYATTCAVHVWLPPAFPNEPPLIRPISPIFHPNVVADGVKVDRIWTSPQSSLADCVRAIGQMLAFQTYEPDDPWNTLAMDWVNANPSHVPTDPEANLSIDAGGEPLARIVRFGPRTLEQIRTQLKQMCDNLIAAEGSPNARDTEIFCTKTRQTRGRQLIKFCKCGRIQRRKAVKGSVA